MTSPQNRSAISMPYVSANPSHAFSYARRTATCSCGFKLWRVGKELAARSHVKHLDRVQQKASGSISKWDERGA